MAHLEQVQLRQQLTPIPPRAASVAELSLVHSEWHIANVREVAEGDGGWLDADTAVSVGSYQAALYAAGGVIEATEAVMQGAVDNAFALVRPPGHHAVSQRAMGFCLFNNIAIAARYALAKHNLERIAIIDFDVHHGNGTQESFYHDPQVLYLSTHESPFYPGTGSIGETGRDEARGTTVNIPLPASCGDNEYLSVFEQIVVPTVRRFDPQLIMVSAGYDAHWADGLAMMQVSVTGFVRMVRIIKELATELCGGKLVLTLEGGYNLNALASSVKATFDVLLGHTDIEDPLGQPPREPATPGIASLISQIKEIHNLG